jgi:hypothetical protein
VRQDSQDVGLEAAIIERVRNSSLVECACTDNVARLKHRTEALEFSVGNKRGLVGERCVGREARPQGLVERTQERMPE